MGFLRKLLLPFGFLYGLITGLRNFFYHIGLLKSFRFEVPVIAVGNLSVGGTGKSPMIEYLIRLLQAKRLATLSRGYKRLSKGFVLADAKSTVLDLGDEPFQFHQKFLNLQVAVDANRKNGIETLLAQPQAPEVILLDDAFQHRRVKAGLYILLTAYGDLYADDFMLPAGNLREPRAGAQRAQIVVVTKCPPDLTFGQQEKIAKKLQLKPYQDLFFTKIAYEEVVYSQSMAVAVCEVKSQPKVLLAGIAKPKPFFDYLRHPEDLILEFPDHHDFSDTEIAQILDQAANRKIITTEKDYMRLQGKIPAGQLYYLPIACAFLKNAKDFDILVMQFVANTLKKS